MSDAVSGDGDAGAHVTTVTDATDLIDGNFNHGPQWPPPMDDEITVEELGSLLDETDDGDDGDDEEVRIVDIRNPSAFARGHIPGSENVPAPELTGRVEELDGADRVVTVCPHGEASVQAARLVAAYEGVDGPVESLRGGLEAWDGPLERESTADDAGAGADGSPAPF